MIQTLEEKEDLVAEMLNIPREHFQHITDIMVSGDKSISREPSEIVLALIFQVTELQRAVNRALNVSEMDQITLKGGKHPSCASQQQQQQQQKEQEQQVVDEQQGDVTANSSCVSSGTATQPLTMQVGVVRDIASSLSSELTTLLVRLFELYSDVFEQTSHVSPSLIHHKTLSKFILSTLK